MIRRCYYKHDWLHKHLWTGIHLNLRRLQGKFHIKWKEPYIFCRSKRKGHVASKTAHVLTLRIKQILSHLHVIDISTDNEIWSSSLHQGNRQNQENLLQRMTFKSTLLATVKSNDVYDWTSLSSCDNVFKTRRVSCHQKVISFKLVFQFLTVWAETLHDNRTLFSQQSYVFGFLILTVFGAKMTS